MTESHNSRHPTEIATVDDAWVPIASAHQLATERPVLPIELLGKQWVLFRDHDGELGLIGRHCPHRGADLCFARREDNGLRCPFHGWHFDRSGQCTEQPAEPEGSTMYTQIKAPSLPVQEIDGRIYAHASVGNHDSAVEGS